MDNKSFYFSKFVLAVFSAVFLFYIPHADARSGCCSHHGGVCGCGCCDGSSLSATCAPYYPACNSAPEPSPMKFKPAVATNSFEPIKFCGFGELFNNKTDAEKSKTDAIQKEKLPLINENDNLKKENQTLKATVDTLKTEKNESGSFGEGALTGLLGAGGLAWYVNKNNKK